MSIERTGTSGSTSSAALRLDRRAVADPADRSAASAEAARSVSVTTSAGARSSSIRTVTAASAFVDAMNRLDAGRHRCTRRPSRRHLYGAAEVEPDLLVVLGPHDRSCRRHWCGSWPTPSSCSSPVAWSDFGAGRPRRARSTSSPVAVAASAGSTTSEIRMSGELYRDRAVVLRTYKLGEADRIVVMMTAEHGKVRAVAKGVRKTKSKFGARLEPMSHVRLLLYRGPRARHRQPGGVGRAAVADARRASTARRRAWRCSRPSTSWRSSASRTRSLYRMRSGCCARSPRGRRRSNVPAFYWKLLAAEGLAPRARRLRAVRRGRPDVPLVAFDVDEGGVLCRTCRTGARRSRRRRWR